MGKDPMNTARNPKARSNAQTCKARTEERVWKEPRLDGVSLLRARYVNHRFAVHRQPTYVIGTNVRGLASCFNRADRIAGPGTLVVVPPDVPHGGHRTSDEAWEYLAIYPTPELLASVLEDLTGKPSLHPEFPELIYPDPGLVRRFVDAHRWLASGVDVLEGEVAMITLLSSLLERYSVPRPAPMRLGREPRPVARAVEFIYSNLESSLSLAEIAGVAGYSRYHFLRVFSKEVGQTPHAYLMQARVERAKELLRRGDGIAEAAYGAGFADQAHLTRRFKGLVGVTPGEFARGAVSRGDPAAEAGRAAEIVRDPQCGAGLKLARGGDQASTARTGSSRLETA